MVKKSAFWQALIFTIIIFIIGIMLGFSLERNRSDEIRESIMDSEIKLLDEQVRESGINIFNVSCEQSKKSTFEFADKIYQESILLEEFDSSSKFTETLKILHKRYDILRTMLWIEAIKLKEKCGEDFHTVVYIYAYDVEDIQTKALQASNSRLLLDIKNANPDKILLIPMAGNLEVESVNLILEKYDVEKLPVIIIDEKQIIEEEITFDEMEDRIYSSPEKSKKTIRLSS